MTVRQFIGLFDEIARVAKFESDGSQSQPVLEGDAAHQYLMRRFGKKKK